MRLLVMQRPPEMTTGLSWRELYVGGAFGQRELVEDGSLRSAAGERGLQLGIGQETLEHLDLSGAFCPVGFSAGYMSGFEVPAEPAEDVRFREEHGPVGWKEYAWEQHGFEMVTALFCPWQLLYLDDVVRATSVEIGVETLLLPGGERDDQLERLRVLLEGQRAVLRSLHESWSPVIKLLVALQNRYVPQFTGSVSVVGVPGGGWVFAGRDWADQDAGALLGQLGCTVEQVVALYHFLVERGLARDSNDGLTMLRRARPRAFHKRWRGEVRRAQDNFDAAQVLWLFLAELGESPGRPDLWPLDGRQLERGELYDRGPATPWSREEIKQQLQDAELYPPGVHVIGEGSSEEIIVQRLTEELLDGRAAHELAFFDLGGSGSAKQVGPLLRSFSDYARRAVAIVDDEGEMARYLSTAVAAGEIDEANVMLFHDSLEGENTTTTELIALAKQIAENPPAGRESVSFELTVGELESDHADRRERSTRNGRPGIADSLIIMVGRKTDGRVRLDKLELVEAIANMLIDEFQSTPLDQLPGLLERRPVIKFFLERIEPVLNRAIPAGREI
jgi:hypothetical protein